METESHPLTAVSAGHMTVTWWSCDVFYIASSRPSSFTADPTTPVIDSPSQQHLVLGTTPENRSARQTALLYRG